MRHVMVTDSLCKRDIKSLNTDTLHARVCGAHMCPRMYAGKNVSIQHSSAVDVKIDQHTHACTCIQDGIAQKVCMKIDVHKYACVMARMPDIYINMQHAILSVRNDAFQLSK